MVTDLTANHPTLFYGIDIFDKLIMPQRHLIMSRFYLKKNSSPEEVSRSVPLKDIAALVSIIYKEAGMDDPEPITSTLEAGLITQKCHIPIVSDTTRVRGSFE